MSSPSSPEARPGPGGEIAWVAVRTAAAILAGVVTYLVTADDGTAVILSATVALGVWVGLEVLRRVFYRRSTG